MENSREKNWHSKQAGKPGMVFVTSRSGLLMSSMVQTSPGLSMMGAKV